MERANAFSQPGCTDGSGISPDRLLGRMGSSSLGGITTGTELALAAPFPEGCIDYALEYSTWDGIEKRRSGCFRMVSCVKLTGA